MLELRDVSRSLGRDQLLDRVSLQVAAETPTAVLGLDAPGREAFLRLMAGVDKPQSGFVRLGGQDIAKARREKGRIIRIGPGGVKPSGQRVGKLVGAEAADRVGLSGRMNAALSELDLDQRVRLAIAMAREGRPGLLLLDSPGLDLGSEPRSKLESDLGHLLGQLPGVILLAGSPQEALGLAGQVAVLASGQLAQLGPAQHVFQQPANLSVAQAISQPPLNLLQMVAQEGAGRLPDGSLFQPPEGLLLPQSGPCTLAFRVQDVRLERLSRSCLRFVVRVEGQQEPGPYLKTTLAKTPLLAPLPSPQPLPGSLLNLFVEKTKLLLFDSSGQLLP